MIKISSFTEQITTLSQCFGLPSPNFYRSMQPVDFRRYYKLGREIINTAYLYGRSDLPFEINLAWVNFQCTLVHRGAAPELFDLLFPEAYADAMAWLGDFDESDDPPYVTAENVKRYIKVAQNRVH